MNAVVVGLTYVSTSNLVNSNNEGILGVGAALLIIFSFYKGCIFITYFLFNLLTVLCYVII